MATLTFNGNSYTVDHAVKGTDYVYGYDANGVCIVALDGVTDFSGVSYDGVYMDPKTCETDPHNEVVYCGNGLRTRDGRNITAVYKIILPASDWSSEAPFTQTVQVDGLLETDNPFYDVSLLDSETDALTLIEAFYCVGVLAAYDGYAVVQCYEEKPTVDIPIILKVVR